MLGKNGGPIIVGLILIAGALYGCVNLGKGTERLPRLYLLSAMASVTETAAGIEGRDLAIGIGPLAFPEYLNRPQIVTRVNGEVRQDDVLSRMIHPIRREIEYISTFMTLEPGDIIVTGTPTGAGARFDPPRFLVPGDVVEVEVEGIGVLRNTVEDEAV